MKKTTEIENLILEYETKITKTQESLYYHSSFYEMNTLSQSLSEINASITEIDEKIHEAEESNKTDSETYDALIVTKNKLLEEQNQINQELKKIRPQYEQRKIEVNKKTQEMIDELIEALKLQLTHIRVQEIDLYKLSKQIIEHEQKYYKKEFKTDENGKILEWENADEWEQLMEYQKRCSQTREDLVKAKKLCESTIKTYKDRQQESEKPKGTQTSEPKKTGYIGFHLEDEKRLEYKNLRLPYVSKTYERMEIARICEDVIMDVGIMGRIKNRLLKRKLNPNTIRALDRIGNAEITRDYIKSIHDKKPFSFDLSCDLSSLTRFQKWRLQKFIRIEEQCGAKFLGKLWDSNIALPEQQAESVSKKRRDTSFVRKANGKNSEVAKNFSEKEKDSNDVKTSDFEVEIDF